MRRPIPILAMLAALLGALAAAPLAAVDTVRAAIVVEPTTWTVLHSHNAHLQQPTASMIKMLNALGVMDALDAGEVTWETPVTQRS